MNRLSMVAIALVCGGLLHAGTIDYNRDIRPILSENCFACHGFDEKARKAKLRLDVRESAYEERDGVTPLKPGDLKNSEAWLRINSDDEEEVMPPPKSHLKLTDADKAKFKAWIEQGAKYAGHWSFIPPQRAAVPEIRNQKSEIRNPIDAFVLARLADEGMKPSPEADRAMLIRRVTFDLTGLPPGAAEVEAFLRESAAEAGEKEGRRDGVKEGNASAPSVSPSLVPSVAPSRPTAYERLVDRLLASPHFGERMALDWLDSARYADTNGFSIDGGRHIWLWRDWVIQAFNDNKRYDRFLIEQLAGDLLPGRTDAELIATGFQRNNMVTHEGGTIPAENLTNYNADRVKTLGESVLGLTLGCAQCHDHKFDPITQKDYYRMFAFFNALDDAGLDGNGGVNPKPFAEAKTVLKTNEVPALQKQIAALKRRLATADVAMLAAWEQREQSRLAMRGKNLKVHPVQVLKVSTPNRGAGFDTEGANGVRLKQAGDLGAFDISTQLPRIKEPITGVRATFHPVAELPGGGWGSGPMEKRVKAKARAKPNDAPTDEPEKGTFVLTAIAATADVVAGDQVNLHKLERIARATASSWDAKYPPAGCLDPRNESGWSPDLSATGSVHLTATFARMLNAAETPFLTVQLNFGHGRSLVPGHIELSVITGSDDGSDLPPAIISILQTAPAKRSAERHDVLWSYCAAHCEELGDERIALANLEDRLAALTQPFPTMVMNASAKPRDTFILNRGDYAQPTVKVNAGTITSLPPMPGGSGPDRLGLANWITMKSNPLTARVAVNRFWKMLFGTGIVATAADFGAQGEWPSHPDVLDWLAVEFMESGWDVKRVIKRIVMSETYRQTSATTPALMDRDPQNRLLARGPRFRLPAELVRDAALKTSGLLVPRIGGPSVNPYMPGDLWREVSHYGSTPATAQTFVQDHGEKLHRRSLYTFWKRTAPPPNMTAFDAPNREVCTVARGNTTTPLQALVTLNDPQFVEAARAFAERALIHSGDDDAKLRWAFLEATSRRPKPAEMKVLQAALSRERQRYTANPIGAATALSVGESRRDSKLPAAEHAAWMQVASLILNLGESVTRN